MLTGFGNHFSSEAVPGALPIGQNSPQKTPFGLYAEQFSATAFTAPRDHNRRSWVYRLRPSAGHGSYGPYCGAHFIRSAPFDEVPPSPNRLRWDPLSVPAEPTDFVDGMFTYGGNGDVAAAAGVAIHGFVATASMDKRAFVNADGEMLIVAQAGRVYIMTEMGGFDLAPLQICVIPRGMRFRVDLRDESAKGYICENYGSPFRLPDLGPIGSNGLANTRDFEAPEAAFEDLETPYELVQKFQGELWSTWLCASPFDVVAWHGNAVPYRYDLRRFNTVNTVSYDHPDPSIFTVLTSPSAVPGTANCDFVIFPPRWMVAEHTFRPPWFHRNVMSEFMGLITGAYDAKAGGFVPGGASLHNQMSSHGPDRASYEQSVSMALKPHKIDNTLAFMFETNLVIRPTRWAGECAQLQGDYDTCWSDFRKAVVPKSDQ